MNYVSVKTIESKTQGGARFVLKRMNDRRRQALGELQADAAAKIKEIFEELGPLNTEYSDALKRARAVGAVERRAAVTAGATEGEALALHPCGPIDFTDEKFARWGELREAVGKIDREEMEPIALRFVVVRIEEFAVDEVPVTTIEELLACEGRPDDFVLEILSAVKRELGLLPEEVENLSSPSTSAAPAGGGRTTGGADLVAIKATTIDAGAASSTDPASADALNIDRTQ